jgi:3-deoxy-D-manno-octulosonic-acid transferase
MGFYYVVFIIVYELLIKVVALWHPKAKLLVEGRKETFRVLQGLSKNKNQRYWFHCASLGEYDMALPLMEACKKSNPELEIFVSFYSPSGMQHYHKRGFVPSAVFYLPADTALQMKHLVLAIDADRLYLLKYEFWPNLLRAAQDAKLETFAVNTILRPSQVYFKWYGGFFRKALQRVAYFGVQNMATQELLKGIGITAQKIEILGDLRWNRVLEAKQNAPKNLIIERFSEASPLLILGSSWPQEEELLFQMIQLEQKKASKILIAPHDLSRAHLDQLKERFPDALFYSQLEKDPTTFNKDQRIMILDTIGHLSAAYQYGGMAFVGGGFSGSLHNILEPLAYGLPVLFGPKHQKFPEAQQFLDLGFAKEVANAKDLELAVQYFLANHANVKTQMMAQLDQLRVQLPTKLLA